MSNTELAVKPENNGLLATTQDQVAAYLEEQPQGGGDFLPRFEITHGLSNVVQNGLAPPNVFVIVHGKNNVEEIGKSCEVCVLASRPKAICFEPESPTIVNYDPTSDVFQKIKETSDGGDKNYRHGLEFLLWIPKADVFATYHFNNRTLRNVQINMNRDIPKAVTLKIEQLENKKGAWSGLAIVPYRGTPFATPEDTEMQAAINDYLALPNTEVEAAK